MTLSMKMDEEEFNREVSRVEGWYNNFQTAQDRKYHVYSLFRDFCSDEGFEVTKLVGSNQVILCKNGKSIYDSETEALTSELYVSFLKDIFKVKLYIDKRADDLTEQMYLGFGSDTGILFGIPSDCRKAVRAVVKLVLKIEEDK